MNKFKIFLLLAAINVSLPAYSMPRGKDLNKAFITLYRLQRSRLPAGSRVSTSLLLSTEKVRWSLQEEERQKKELEEKEKNLKKQNELIPSDEKAKALVKVW